MNTFQPWQERPNTAWNIRGKSRYYALGEKFSGVPFRSLNKTWGTCQWVAPKNKTAWKIASKQQSRQSDSLQGKKSTKAGLPPVGPSRNSKKTSIQSIQLKHQSPETISRLWDLMFRQANLCFHTEKVFEWVQCWSEEIWLSFTKQRQQEIEKTHSHRLQKKYIGNNDK